MVVCLCGVGLRGDCQVAMPKQKSAGSLPVHSEACTKGRNGWLQRLPTEGLVNLQPHRAGAKACLGTLWCTWNYTAEGLEVVCLLGAKQEA